MHFFFLLWDRRQWCESLGLIPKSWHVRSDLPASVVHDVLKLWGCGSKTPSATVRAKTEQCLALWIPGWTRGRWGGSITEWFWGRVITIQLFTVVFSRSLTLLDAVCCCSSLSDATWSLKNMNSVKMRDRCNRRHFIYYFTLFIYRFCDIQYVLYFGSGWKCNPVVCDNPLNLVFTKSFASNSTVPLSFPRRAPLASLLFHK